MLNSLNKRSFFGKILIPVDFSDGSDIAINKAIELADPAFSVIYFLYVVKPLFSLNIFSSTGFLFAPVQEILFETGIEDKIEKYKAMVRDKAPWVKTETIISEYGAKQTKIEKAAALVSPDLIIIYRGGSRPFLPFFKLIFPDRIAKNTNSLVLTIKQGSSSGRIKNIVLPVTTRMPERKLEVAIAIAKKFNANIHLMTFPENDTAGGNKDQAFIDSFNRLRENVSLNIKHGPLKGHNIAKAVLHYSKTIHADMILANPQTESSIHSITGTRHISDMLPGDSPIQVLDMEPYSLI